MGFVALALGGFEEAADDAVVFQPFGGAGILDYAAPDDDGTQTALGLIVGGWDLGMFEAGAEAFLLRAEPTLAKGFGPRMAQGDAAKKNPATFAMVKPATLSA